MSLPVLHELRAIFRDAVMEEAFHRYGFLVVPFLSPEQVAELRQEWDALDAPIHQMGFSASVMSADRAYRDSVDAAVRAAFAPGLQAMCDAYRFGFGNFVAKRAGATDGIPIHQDGMFVDEHRFESINLWVPLVTVGPENGCLRVMPGSHGLNRATRGTNRRFPYPELNAVITERYLVDVPMRAGEACVMSQRTFHTSHPNLTGEHRVCASALAVPDESALYYLYEPMDGSSIEVYAVDDAFYRYQVFGSPVVGIDAIAQLTSYADVVDEKSLETAFAAF